MNHDLLTKKGKIKKRFKPAMYLDTSVVVDYWMTEGFEIEISEEYMDIIKDEPHEVLIKDLLKTDKRLKRVIEIRKKFIFEETKITPIISPLSFLELVEWKAEASIKQIASQAVGSIFIQKKGKKEIGDLLAKINELRKNELDNIRNGKIEKPCQTTPLKLLAIETKINLGFALSHGLSGLYLADIVNFNLNFQKYIGYPYELAYLQLGIGDILHIMLAKHLGCDFIASFDADFKRSKDIIVNNTGMIVLTDPDEIMAIL
jgi:hypothetical protein